MPTFLQPVELPERCYLEEVLYWVAFQRLPIAGYLYDGKEIRQNDEMGYAPEIVDAELSEDETQRAGIPPDPNWRALMDDTTTLSSAHYDKFLAKDDLDPGLREIWTVEREAALAFEKECSLWQPHYERAIEYPCSRIFVALKEGRLAAKGRLLPALDLDAATATLDANDQSILDIVPTNIAPSFWTLKGIDFESSAAQNSSAHYCHISCPTDDVLKVFPGDREQIHGVERIGDTLILSEKPRGVRSVIHRGRPSYPWDGFHIRPSRAAVGEKLKPYFDRFVKSLRQKI
jgi:hypothetical protein